MKLFCLLASFHRSIAVNKGKFFVSCCGLFVIIILLGPVVDVNKHLVIQELRSVYQHTRKDLFNYETESGSETLTFHSDKHVTISDLTQMLEHQLRLPNPEAKQRIVSKKCEGFDDANNTYPNHKPCRDAKCDKIFNRSLEARVKDILTSPQYQLDRRKVDAITTLAKDVPEADVIIASAVSSNHFYEMQAMFQNLHQTVYGNMDNFHVVLFDIGLSSSERRLTEENCRCQVVTFNFTLLPGRLSDLHCYSWKPLIIRAMFTRARKLVIWQDASVRWGPKFKVLFERALTYGVQVFVGGGDKVTANTVHQTFKYMEEPECLFEWVPEVCNAVAVYNSSSLMQNLLIDPWCRCALEESCMCPQEPKYIRHCSRLRPRRCHRFDQSAITLLLTKLYYTERYKLEIPESLKDVRLMRKHLAPQYFQSLASQRQGEIV